MPNHVINKVSLRGDEKKIRELLEAVRPAPSEESPNPKLGSFDFNKVIPMPEELNIEAGSTTTRGIELYLTAVNPDTEDYDLPKMPKDKFNELVNALNGERIFYKYKVDIGPENITERMLGGPVDEMMELGKKAITNFQNYGATTWYDWSVRNWGTKWNAYDCEYAGDGVLWFQTAWSAPHPVMEALAKMHPDISFTHEWADEDIGYNCGSCRYEDGMSVEEHEPVSMKDAIRFAEALWSMDPTENT